MACNLTLNPAFFNIKYGVNGHASPDYRVNPWVTTLSPFNPSPFNSELTPFLIPAAAEEFEFHVRVDSAPGGYPVHWRVSFSYFNPPPGNAIIVSPGNPANNVASFSFRYGQVTEMVNPGTFDGGGWEGFNANRIYGYQPGDLPVNIPVRLEITLQAYSDPAFTQPVTDTDPSNNVLNFWLMRV